MSAPTSKVDDIKAAFDKLAVYAGGYARARPDKIDNSEKLSVFVTGLLSHLDTEAISTALPCMHFGGAVSISVKYDEVGLMHVLQTALGRKGLRMECSIEYSKDLKDPRRTLQLSVYPVKFSHKEAAKKPYVRS